MPEPEITAPNGPLAALLLALATLAGLMGKWLHRKTQEPAQPAQPTQLDRIEKAVGALTADVGTLLRCLVVETADGGRATASRKLAEGIMARLGEIEKKIDRRLTQRTTDMEKLADLARNVDSLGDAVRSAIDVMNKRIGS